MSALRSEPDDRDWVYEHLVCGPGEVYQPLPDEFTLDQYRNPARHQQVGPTCAAFVGASIREILTRLNGEDVAMIGEINCSDSTNTCVSGCGRDGSDNIIYMSPEFIYFHRVNKPNAGMYGRDVFQVMRRIGIVPEHVYPYLEGAATSEPADHMYAIAGKYRIENYARITTTTGLKRALVELGPCYLGLPMYNLTERFWDVTHGHDMDTGHAVVVIGYNTAGFTFLNSWGPDWGNGGVGVFPYEDFGANWEIWVAIVRKKQPMHVSRRHSIA